MDKIENLIIANNDFYSESFLFVLINFAFAAIMLILLSQFYRRNSSTIGGKNHLSSIIPIIGMIVFLVIGIVKSSLALSLGLVGALSIVRFRTPIKEPEELAYIFFAIAIGLGYAASQTWATTVVSLLIMMLMYITSRFKGTAISKDGDFSVIIEAKAPIEINKIEKALFPDIYGLKVNRIESSGDNYLVSFLISLKPKTSVETIIDKIKKNDSNINVSLIESGINW